MVGLGGLVGSMLRYRVGLLVTHFPGSQVPWGTLAVNLSGCLLIGCLSILVEKRPWLNAEIRHLLMVGLLGGFTTFSAFGLETVTLLRRGKLPWAVFYLAVSVVGGLFLVWVGQKLTQALLQR